MHYHTQKCRFVYHVPRELMPHKLMMDPQGQNRLKHFKALKSSNP